MTTKRSMTTPEPRQTPEGPTYQGRLLPNPDEEVVDQGLGFDLVTLVSRRRMLGAMGIGAGTALLAACGTGASTTAGGAGESGATSSAGLTEIPDETAGPYPGDGSNGPDVLEESGIVRSDIRSGFGDSSGTAEGVPLEFTLTILDMAGGGSPFVGVAVYAWHCDRDGGYSMYSEGIEGENYLRGVQITDEAGTVTFTSIFPACYSGRWPHIHFEVYPDADAIADSTNAIATSQLALPQNACDAVYATTGYERSVSNLAAVTLAGDNVFGDDGGAHQIATTSGDVGTGYLATLTVPVDTTTEPTAGAMGGGGDMPPGGPGGG
jgi:protocatechuate 3,4-dioxygenase beta subunit